MFSATGRMGRLKVGYQLAAVLGDWQLATNQGTLNYLAVEINAVVKEVDKFWISYSSFSIELLIKPEVWWRWKASEVSGDLTQNGSIYLVGIGEPVVIKGN